MSTENRVKSLGALSAGQVTARLAQAGHEAGLVKATPRDLPAASTLEVRRPEDFDPVFAAAAGKPLGGVLTMTSNLTFRNGKRIMDFALANRLPTLCEFRELAQAGCLLSDGATNLKTAKALGLAIPQALLLRADEVIQ